MPATNTQVDNVLSLLQRAKRGGPLLDIGSGDGRIVIGIGHFSLTVHSKKHKSSISAFFIPLSAAAKQGFESHGVELNTWLVQYSRIASLYHRVFGQTKFYRKDLWKFDVSQYRYIVIFGVEQMVLKLMKSP